MSEMKVVDLEKLNKNGKVALHFFEKENVLILAHYTDFFYKQDSKEKKNYKEVQRSGSSFSKPSEIRSSPPPKPLSNRRRAPEPISTRWRPQRRAYF